ncbi:DUF3515 domain-containing protein [Propionibacteriaceae bacterium Y1923]|uniref:DUF3515 domain-containing protein n=1 Tax=Aestuariimicrobium sp. Y1814 TaxID=3418742 RepID=UPI003C21DB15
MLASAVVALLVAGCSAGPPPLPQPSPTGVVAQECAAVMAALPATVMGQGDRVVDGLVATWGDPRISLRCGVEPPAGLDRTSPCDELNGIGWYSEEPGTAFASTWRFTTIGRSGYIEVMVDEGHSPAGDALMDLSGAVSKMMLVTPCA